MFFVVCFAVSFTVVHGAVSPVHVWPLLNITCAYDVIEGVDALSPTFGSCLPYGSEHPDLPWKTLTLNASLPEAIRVNVTSTNKVAPEDKDGSYKDFSIAIHFKPSTLSGVLFDFESPQVCPRCLTRLTATLQSTRDVMVVFKAGQSSTSKTATSETEVTLDDWNYLVVSVDASKSLDKLFFTHDLGTAYERGGLAVKVGAPWLPPGTLHVGRGANDTSPFHGDVACVSINVGDKKLPFAESIVNCKPPFPQSPPGLPETKPPEIDSFPLYALARGSSKNGSQLIPTPFWRPISDVSAPALGFLRMDGSQFSAVDIGLNFSLFLSDFSVGLYLYLDNGTHGTLAHVTGMRHPSLKELRLVLNSTHVLAAFYDAEATCRQLVAPLTAQDTWEVVVVGMRGGNPMLQGHQDVDQDGCRQESAPVSGNAQMFRLGASLGEAEGLHGDVSCMTTYDMTFPSFLEVSAQVKRGCRLQVDISANDASLSVELVEYGYKLISRHKLPAEVLRPFLEFPARSVSACAKECRVEAFCRSFALTSPAPAKAKRLCRLFDLLTVDGLVEEEGAVYYKMAAVTWLK